MLIEGAYLLLFFSFFEGSLHKIKSFQQITDFDEINQMYYKNLQITELNLNHFCLIPYSHFCCRTALGFSSFFRCKHQFEKIRTHRMGYAVYTMHRFYYFRDYVLMFAVRSI